jgi:UDP-N-acetylglucosamine:LPS N-acetylglucosamine transferase
MKQKKTVLVLTDDMPWGHRSIAKAIYGYLKTIEKEDGYKVIYREIKATTGLVGDLYVFGYRYMPQSNRMAHMLSKKRVGIELLEEASVLNLPRLKKEVEEINPDLIISTYFFHTHSLARWRKKENKKFGLWTVVADPWTINPTSFVKGADLHLVYDRVAFNEGLNYGLDKDKMMITGWWTRQEMYKNYNYLESRKKLGFDDDRPVIFLGGGSLGTNSLTRILPSLMMVDKKVGLIINTGVDKLSFNLVEQYKKMFERIRKDGMVKIVNMGWIDNMAEVLSACDIVFGKAGPNFLFDVVAVGKPFVALTHIGGQEDGNIDLIRKKKLGWIREKNGEISDFLFEFLENPVYFEKKFMEEIRTEGERNEKTLPMIGEMVCKRMSHLK